MRVVIITFSPSGATAETGRMLGSELESRGAEVECHELSEVEGFFKERDYKAFLRNRVGAHDVICFGSPIYEHHIQEDVIGLIKALPEPDEYWGRYALPLVTYGYISSGIALYQEGSLLKKSGRKVISGLKIARKHTMLDTLLGRKIGREVPENEVKELLSEAAERIMALEDNKDVADQTASLNYQPLVRRLVDHTLLNPKLRFVDVLPGVKIDQEKCVGCGLCVQKCPTGKLYIDSSSRLRKSDMPCMHCFSCMAVCPKGAISTNRSPKILESVVKILTRNGYEEPSNAIFPSKEL